MLNIHEELLSFVKTRKLLTNMHNGKKAILIMLLCQVVLSGTAQTVNHWETIIKAEESWKYIVPSSEPDTNWRYTGFDDASWSTGPGGFGYGDNDDRTTVAVATKSVFFRKTFEITDTSVITSLILNADYDDAFVAWINGKEVARGGGLTDRIPAYDKLASYTHEAVIYNGGNPESYLIQKDKLKKNIETRLQCSLCASSQ
ncbi:MAG: hypothetical protein HC905_16505 [Bacteroidales bacterium]|nr:hypothetical protein [Bacteroidales bacterium]